MTTHSTSLQLTRSREGIIGGVASGLAKRFGVDPNLVRVAWAATVLLFGTGFLLYLVLWWLMPHEDRAGTDPIIWRRNSDGQHHPPLMRTTRDKKIAGVCGGLARRWGIDPTLVRLGALSLLTVTGPLALLAYGIAAFAIPSNGDRQRPVHTVEF